MGWGEQQGVCRGSVAPRKVVSSNTLPRMTKHRDALQQRVSELEMALGEALMMADILGCYEWTAHDKTARRLQAILDKDNPQFPGSAGL